MVKHSGTGLALTTFVLSRIQKNMLMDLNKEIMNELGITVIGDIIAILKHAKVVYIQVGPLGRCSLLRFSPML